MAAEGRAQRGAPGGNVPIVSGLIRLPGRNPPPPVSARTTAIERNETPHCPCGVVGGGVATTVSVQRKSQAKQIRLPVVSDC